MERALLFLSLLTTPVSLVVCQQQVNLLTAFPYKVPETEMELTATDIPSYVQGSYVRQSCGGFGDISLSPSVPPRRIEHMFDCMSQVVAYQLDGSNNEAFFKNKFYDDKPNNIWKSYGYNFSLSGISWDAVFQHYDEARAQNWSGQFKDKYDGHPNVDFWHIPGGPEPAYEAVTENLAGLQFDPVTLEMHGNFPFDDDLIAKYQSNSSFLIDVPAHAKYDHDGIPWSVVGFINMTQPNEGLGKAYYLIYKIEDNKRQVQGQYTIGDVKLSLCAGSGDTIYPDYSAMIGYMHSFAMTENYVILTASSYGVNYCSLMLPSTQQNKIFFDRAFPWVRAKPGKFIVFDKRTKAFIRDLSVGPAFFATHQANAYETGSEIHADMVTYNVAAYSYFNLNHMIRTGVEGTAMLTNKIERFTLDTNTWSLVGRRSLAPSLTSMEFPQINQNRRGQAYRFVYLVGDPYNLTTGTKVIKFNVDTGAMLIWTPPFGELASEPVFVPSDGISEDDGALLVSTSATRGNPEGKLYILDPQTMTVRDVLHAPINTPMGLHAKFFSGAAQPTVSLALLAITIIIQRIFIN